MKGLAQFLAAVAVVALLSSASLDSARYEVLPTSRIWIDGSSTVGAYSCAGDRVTGYGVVEEEHTPTVEVEVAVPVRSFDCGIRQMNSDLAEALKAESHPNISFSLDRVDVLLDSPAHGVWVPITAVGDLVVAGTQRRVSVALEGQKQSDAHVRIRGSVPLEMTDFGIDPPTRLLGLVRTRNEIDVRFDIRATRR
ncbi:MAG: YceI family protein [Rubricoccaceae bacterium]|nr:YceI family protein [Rubricoccaceae bacterium]